MKRGVFIVVDGIDGSGKGAVVDHLGRKLRRLGPVFDTRAYEQRTKTFPTVREWGKAAVILSAEPTFAHVGRLLRDYLIRNGTRATPRVIAEAFAEDRLLHYRQVVLPALAQGIHVIQERSVTSSLIYNPLSHPSVTRQWTQKLPGNAFALAHAPDLVLLMDVDPAAAAQRRHARLKKDGSFYESLAFLRRVRRAFGASWFRTLLRQRGSMVVDIDAGRTLREVLVDVDRIVGKLETRNSKS